MTINEGATPSIEEIRRHWGLAVDVHRREERLAEFDRTIAINRAAGITHAQAITLTVLSASVAKAGIAGNREALAHALNVFNAYIDTLVVEQ